GERRIPQDAVHRKNDAVPNLRGNPIVIALSAEIPCEPGFGNVCSNGSRINPFPRRCQPSLVNIGAKYHQVAVQIASADLLFEQDSQRVRCLAGRAARYPDSNRLVSLAVVNQGYHDLGAKSLPCSWIPKERRHRNQQIVEETLNFGWGFTQKGQVVIEPR